MSGLRAGGIVGCIVPHPFRAVRSRASLRLSNFGSDQGTGAGSTFHDPVSD